MVITMRFQYQSTYNYQPLRRETIAVFFALLFPVVLPCLFASSSTFSPLPLVGGNKNMTWLDFRQAVAEGHQNRQGQLRLRKPKQSIYTYPSPDCMCQA